MFNIGDKVKIINNLGELALATKSFLEIMEIDSSKFVSYQSNYDVLNKEGIIIKISVEDELYFIQLADGNICAMFEKDDFGDRIDIYLEEI